MRILHLITALGVGGAERQLSILAEAMQKAGHQVTVVSMVPGGHFSERLEAAGIQVFNLGMERGRPGLGAIRRLLKILARTRPQVVQSWLYHADLLATCAAIFYREATYFWNLRCSELDPRDRGAIMSAIIRILAMLSRRPEAIISNSIAGKDYHISTGYAPRHWGIIPNAIDTEEFAPSIASRKELRATLKIAESAPLVGHFARYHPMKDHAAFIRAAVGVAQRFPAAHFVMAGAGVDNENAALANLLRTTGLGSKVHLLGCRSDVAHLQAALDVAVSSSAYGEGFPNAMGEAMSCGVPCVCTDSGDVRSILGETGIVVQARRPDDLAAGICRLLDMDDIAKRSIGQRARQRIIENYSVQSVMERYVQLYRKFGGGSGDERLDG